MRRWEPKREQHHVREKGDAREQEAREQQGGEVEGREMRDITD